MKDIAIFGAGGLSKEIASLIGRINKDLENKWNLIGFFDDDINLWGHDISHFGKVLGGMDELNAWNTSLDIVIAIGSPNALRKVRQRITNNNVHFPNIISPDFMVVDKDTFNIGEGNIIQGGCCVSNDVAIGSYNLINGDVVMGHDSKVGNYNVIMPDIRISGEVTIGDNNLLGVGSIIIQQISVGYNVHLGAGAVLMTKPKDGCTYIGNPAKLFKF